MSDVEKNRPDEARPVRRTADLARFGRWLAGPAGPGVIGVFFTIATAAFSAAGGVAPDLAVEGWTSGRGGWLVTFGVLAVVTLVAGATLWWWRNRLRQRLGVAYVINEVAAGWTPEQKEGFLRDVRDRFAVFRPVPPLRTFDRAAVWPQGSQATRWGRDVDSLVRHFQVASYDPDGRDATLDRSLFVWAPWPVAVAFGQQVTAAERGRALRVRQRDSFGRQGPLLATPVADGHTFQGQFDRTAGGLFGDLRVLSHPAQLRVIRDDPADAGQVPGDDEAGQVARDAEAGQVPVGQVPGDGEAGPAAGQRQPTPEVLLLVLRTNHHEFGRLPRLPVDVTQRAAHDFTAALAADREPIVVELHDAAGLGLPETASTTLREWRYLPRPGETYHHWEDYPQIVTAAVQWIAEQVAEAPGATVLLGAQLPQEVSVGLGIRSARQSGWPRHLWPLVHSMTNGTFTVPGLNLGR
ncbi:hypothetical protein O7632_20520 [Solwaraspora sp. WMMD406]|uniref:hypothetical protein n=1 Tax=Solwaraspora sp. WMMD406 TaxID=3016095 RepID=UPI002417CA39|nr:hypothetical protein [Solwaraspora sp. WMMD406]MDG4766466.1 hypothetical protein [Solwaraspora sp. WMMD406]